MSLQFIKNDTITLLLEIKTHKNWGRFDSLNYKELVKVHDYLQKANAILDGVIQ